MRALGILLVTVALAWGVWTLLSVPDEPGPALVEDAVAPPPAPADPESAAAHHRLRLTTGTLVVTVRTPSGEIPEGSQAGYRYAGDTRMKPVNAQGEARFTDAPLGTLTVLATAPRCEEVSQQREVLAGIRADVFLVLRPPLPPDAPR